MVQYVNGLISRDNKARVDYSFLRIAGGCLFLGGCIDYGKTSPNQRSWYGSERSKVTRHGMTMHWGDRFWHRANRYGSMKYSIGGNR